MISLSLYIIPIILFFLSILLTIPIYTTINLDIVYNESKKIFVKNTEQVENEAKKKKNKYTKDKLINKIYVKLFNRIKIYSYDIEKNILIRDSEQVFEKILSLYEKINKETKQNDNNKTYKKKTMFKNLLNDYLKSLYIERFFLVFGVNTKDHIYNSYINAILNASLCMYINTKQEKFNFKKLYYSIYTSKEPIKFKIIITFKMSIVKTLIESLKRFKKENKIKIKFKRASIF